MSRTKGAKDLDHEAKRRDLLEKMTPYLMARGGERASFREMAKLAGVSTPTLRHYFGDRRALIDAVLEECLRRGRPGLDAQRLSDLPFEASIAVYAHSLVNALRAEKSVRLGDVFALSLAEGLIDPTYGRPALEHIVEPTLQALEARLRLHIARGEMRSDADPRLAALQLVSPLLLACLHQDQLDGADLRRMDLEAMIASTCDAFLRAFSAPGREPAAMPVAINSAMWA